MAWRTLIGLGIVDEIPLELKKPVDGVGESLTEWLVG
jgi:hypothetical protein